MSGKIAVYLRLSSEDGDLKDTGKLESESISNQRGLLQDFIRGRPEFDVYEIVEFCDDGWSGKNFERPGFIEMMKAVRHREIHCIVVKDFSRFGRDYLEVGNYLSCVFPFLGVRFISVNDGFDSSRPQDIDSLDTEFKTLIYDLYSRELSRKVKSAKRQRAEQGLFLSPFAPYGYVKDPDNKNRLVVDDEAAEVVRRIFTMMADGIKLTEIVTILNREGVPTPMLYKRGAGCSRGYWPSIHDENIWTPGMLFKLFRDERYVGKCVYGKRERDRVGHWHTVKYSRSDWVVVDETHEGIVSKELFWRVQARMREYKEYEPVISDRNPLRGKVVCGTCGYAMALSNTKNAKYHCKIARFEDRYGCSSGGILQADINELVVTQIRTYAAYAVSLERLSVLQAERLRMEKKRAVQELAALQGRSNQLEAALQELYEQLIEGNIDREAYLSDKQRITAQLQEVAARIEMLGELSQTPADGGNAFIDKYKAYIHLETLAGDVAQELVECVTIYPDARVHIDLALRDELEILLCELDAALQAS